MITRRARPADGWPTDPAVRRSTRAEIRAEMLALARRQAATAGYSLVCEVAATKRDHAFCSGALNCLCKCHDGSAS